MLQDRVILITNVCHFVGRPTVAELLRQGARVHAHDASFADASAANAFERENPGVMVSGESDPATLVARVVAADGRIDVLINNDAAPAIRAPVAEAKLQDMRDGLEAMVVTPFALSGAVVPQMRAQGGGKILFVTSAAPLRGLPNYSMYVTARGAANALALSLARELARDNIQVNAIAPNYVESPTYFPPELLADPEALAKITRNIPLGRLGKPEEAAGTIAFFCSDQSSFITGHVLPFAGGWA